MEGLVRAASATFVVRRAGEREALRERQVGRERRPGAACGLDSCVGPPLRRATPPPLCPPRYAYRSATLFMIASARDSIPTLTHT